MPETKQSRTRILLLTILLFILSAAIRALLTLLSGARTALSYPDELFSLKLAQSLWHHGSFTVYCVSAGFPAALYSALLAPFYTIGDASARLAAMTVFNAVLLSSALFPAGLLARRFLHEGRWRLFALLAFFLTPDLNLSATFLPENLFIPLFLWAVLAFVRFREKKTWPRALALGLLCACLVLTRYLGFIFALCAALFLAADILGRKGARGKAFSLLLVFLAAAAVPVLLVAHLFFPGQLPAAVRQLIAALPSSPEALLFALLAALCFLLAFLFTAGIFPVLCPPSASSSENTEARKLFRFLALFVVLAALATAVFASLRESYGTFFPQVLLRLAAPAAPLFFLLFLAKLKKPRVSSRRRSGRLRPSFTHPFAVAVYAFAVLSALLLCPLPASVADAPALAMLRDLPLVLRLLPAVLAIAGLLLWRFSGQKRKLFPLFAAVLFFVLELSGTAAFWPSVRASISADAVDEAQLRQLDDVLASLDGNVLVIAETSDSPALRALDSHITRDYAFASLEDLNPLVADIDPQDPCEICLNQVGVPLPTGLQRGTGKTVYPFHEIDYIVSLDEASRPYGWSYEELTPIGLTFASVWKQEEPGQLTLRHPVTYTLDETISFTEEGTSFENWPSSGFSYPEAGWTWTNGNESVLSLVLEPEAQDAEYLIAAWSRAMTVGDQLCRVEANGEIVFEGTLSGEGDISLWIPSSVLTEDGVLSLHFFFPYAMQPSETDPRLLAVAFTDLTITAE